MFLNEIAPEFEKFKEKNPQEIQLIGLKHINLKEASEEIRKQFSQQKEVATTTHEEKQVHRNLANVDFVHLHNHTQFSVLQSTISVADLVKAAVENKMPAVAMTDHANLMGAFHFVRDILYHNKTAQAKNIQAEDKGELPTETIIKPIVGCEFFVCDDLSDKSRKDNGYQIVFLAKTKKGYHNLAKLSSIAYTEGFYYVPRVDKALIEQYRSDLMVLSGGLEGEIASLILNVGEKQAEDSLCWWKEQFNDDFYVEINRHHLEAEDHANEVLVRLAEKHQVKLVATNNTYYINQSDAQAHDVLLCIRNGELLSTPKGRGRGYRFGFENDEYYFKSPEQMKQLFADLPEALDNTVEIARRCSLPLGSYWRTVMSRR